jgi:2-keto-4-pentenoate hydratase/2-oxohepta-3-ene-1,7-dioic acid hydratase in catechol pathway
MKIARVLLEEHAPPQLALVCDGAYYSVAELERFWGVHDRPGDYYVRVFASGAAGLAELEARLLSGDRPTEARMHEGQFMLLPPHVPHRSAVWLFPPHGADSAVGLLQRDGRSALGDAQPVPMWDRGGPRLEVSMACLVGDELRHATRHEARRALMGYTLLLDWQVDDDRWQQGLRHPEPPLQLGPYLVTPPMLPRLPDMRLVIECDGQKAMSAAVGGWSVPPWERLAQLSRVTELRPGDVVGLGAVAGARLPAAGMPLGYRQHVRVELDGVMALEGWAVAELGDPLTQLGG